MPDLEKTVDFNISDCFVPFKPLRHFSKILKYNDNSMKVSDLITNHGSCGNPGRAFP